MDEELVKLGNAGFILAMQLVGRREDAADVLQDSVQTVLQKRRSFNPQRGEFRSWFFKIIRNRAIDLLRRRGRRENSPETVETLESGNPGPDVTAENRELLNAVRSELSAMPNDQAEIILLRDYHGLGYHEIANVLGIPKGTVMSRLHRARSELRRRMQAHL